MLLIYAGKALQPIILHVKPLFLASCLQFENPCATVLDFMKSFKKKENISLKLLSNKGSGVVGC